MEENYIGPSLSTGGWTLCSTFYDTHRCYTWEPEERAGVGQTPGREGERHHGEGPVSQSVLQCGWCDLSP